MATVAEKAPLPRKLAVIPKRKPDEIVNLERVDLADRENWLRALDICQANDAQPLNNLLHEIETYQGQIDQALQTAQAQSTIYAYAIGSRLDVIEEKHLSLKLGQFLFVRFSNQIQPTCLSCPKHPPSIRFRTATVLLEPDRSHSNRVSL